MSDFEAVKSFPLPAPPNTKNGVVPWPHDTLDLTEPLAGEMRRANGQMRSGVNNETVYLRNLHLIVAVTARVGQPWPLAAVERLPDGLFTEAANYLMGFQERANFRAMEEAARLAMPNDDETSES